MGQGSTDFWCEMVLRPDFKSHNSTEILILSQQKSLLPYSLVSRVVRKNAAITPHSLPSVVKSMGTTCKYWSNSTWLEKEVESNISNSIIIKHYNMSKILPSSHSLRTCLISSNKLISQSSSIFISSPLMFNFIVKILSDS